MIDIKAVVAAQAYIGTHYSDPDFTIDAVCDAAGYSRRQLDRLFVKHTAMKCPLAMKNLCRTDI